MKFSCGCEYEKLDWEKVPLDCQATWDLICNGFTKGVFQLEKPLGKRWAKKIQPRNIEELSDVISIIRPGPTKAEFRENPEKEGKQLTIADTYVQVRNGKIKPEYLHETLEPVFKDTFSVPIYQEQIMRICTDFAGFSMLEADDMRKAVGKKVPEKMKKLHSKFVEGAKKQGHEEGMAEIIFSWIDKFSGYGFNKSHGVGYAMLGYLTAYAKVHFPVFFFKHMLANSDAKAESAEEIKELVNEAKLASMWSGVNIDIVPPSLKNGNDDFSVENDSRILFGLSHIKGVGAAAMRDIKKGNIGKIDNWRDFLSRVILGDPKAADGDGKPINKGVIEALIKAGALEYLKNEHAKHRIEMLRQFKILHELTEREVARFFELWTCSEPFEHVMFKLLESGVPKGARPERIKQTILDINKELGGSVGRMVIGYEKALLGIALSGAETDLYRNPKVNTSCRDFVRLNNKANCTLGVIIDDIRAFKDKNGNMMAFIKVSDGTYGLDSVIMFSKTYAGFSWILDIGKPILINGRKDNDSLIINHIDHL
jgi:DNA polymerase-3 subunit alpha